MEHDYVLTQSRRPKLQLPPAGGVWWVSSTQGVSSQGPPVVPPGLGLRKREAQSQNSWVWRVFIPSCKLPFAASLREELVHGAGSPRSVAPGSPEVQGWGHLCPPSPQLGMLPRSSSWICSCIPSLGLLQLPLAFYLRDQAGAALAWQRTPERLRHEY